MYNADHRRSPVDRRALSRTFPAMTAYRTHRSVFLLAICQALYMTSIGATFIAVALVGNTLADDKSLATLPAALQFVAAILTTLPASFFMRRVGRQRGFITGAAIACVGALICTYAIF